MRDSCERAPCVRRFTGVEGHTVKKSVGLFDGSWTREPEGETEKWRREGVVDDGSVIDSLTVKCPNMIKIL